jgi:hypothetical protein
MIDTPTGMFRIKNILLLNVLGDIIRYIRKVYAVCVLGMKEIYKKIFRRISLLKGLYHTVAFYITPYGRVLLQKAIVT